MDPVSGLILGFVALWLLMYLGRRQSAKEELARLRNAHSLEDLLALSPAQFEDHVAQLLGHHGYRNLRTTRATGDRGVDLRGVDAQGRSVVVQCKRYAPSSTVGGPALRDLAGTVRLHKADRGVFVTTSGYTRDAVDTARQCGIETIGGAELVRLHEAAFPGAVVADAPPGPVPNYVRAPDDSTRPAASADPLTRLREPERAVSERPMLERPAGPAPSQEHRLTGVDPSPGERVRTVRFGKGRALAAKAQVQGEVELEGLSLVPERYAEPNEFLLVVEVRNRSAAAQNYHVEFLLRTADGGVQAADSTYIEGVGPGRRGIGRHSLEVDNAVAAIEVDIRPDN